MRKADLYERTAEAMKNIIDGYGDRYLIPGRSLLDDLAEDFGYKEAGAELKKARDVTKAMIRSETAATCQYVEANRRDTAINFVLDAFNGKVDSILSRVKHDNAGTLEQEIRDAFALVNLNGKAFRDACIMEPYLAARLNELKWAAKAQQLRIDEREEQRRLKEQIREEEKAKREYEREMRENARDQEVLRAAMEKAQREIEQATTEQKAKYEQQLQELSERLKEAEAQNQRVLSMAQQTKKGNVYIISNVGSFGEEVYKIGLTRRLDPLDRIRELGDSSVPFEFDVHAMIMSDNAPALETQLHKHFALLQMNKVNYRKEFFRVDLKHIREEVEKLGILANWTMTAEAREYRETIAVENAIRDNPAARDAWLKRQLELEPVAELSTDDTPFANQAEQEVQSN
jgi:DNA repair exonuclease SbcCD ATPase subunit